MWNRCGQMAVVDSVGVLICTSTARKLIGSGQSFEDEKNFYGGGVGAGGGSGFGGGGGLGGGGGGGYGVEVVVDWELGPDLEQDLVMVLEVGWDLEEGRWWWRVWRCW